MMLPSPFALQVILAILSFGAPLEPRGPECYENGMKIFTVPGSTCGAPSQNACDLTKPGSIVPQLLDSDSNYENVPYLATLTEDPVAYNISLTDGVVKLRQALHTYVDACEKGKIVLIGYSQGADVVTTALAGDARSDPKGKEPMEGRYADRITAAVVLADPTTNRQYASPDIYQGSFTGQGQIYRDQASTEVLNSFADRLRSYCAIHDPVCDQVSPTDINIHTSYYFTLDRPEYYIDDMVKFVKSKA